VKSKLELDMEEFFMGFLSKNIDQGKTSFRLLIDKHHLVDLNAFLISELLSMDFKIIYITASVPWVAQKSMITRSPMMKVYNINKINMMNIIDTIIPSSMTTVDYYNVTQLQKPYSFPQLLKQIPIAVKKGMKNLNFSDGIMDYNDINPVTFIIIDDITGFMPAHDDDLIIRFVKFMTLFTEKYKNLNLIINQSYYARRTHLKELYRIIDKTHIFK